MSQQKVKANVTKAVKDAILATDAAASISWPNVRFEPPASGVWFGVFYFPSPTLPITLGDDGEDELRCFVQVDVAVPTNSGEKTQTDILKAIEDDFPAGKHITHDGQTSTVLRTARSSGRLDGGHWKTSLSIYFYSRFQRATQ